MVRFCILLTLFLASCARKEDSLQRMMVERPEMVFPGYDSLLTMAREKGARWSSKPHPVSSGADFSEGIQLREGMSTEEAWSSLFFETYNLRSEKDFTRIYREGVEGKHDRNSWVRENSHVEYLNGQEFVKFAKDTLIPFYNRHGLGTTEVERMISIFETPFEQWLRSPQDSYPWSYWGKYYDENLKR